MSFLNNSVEPRPTSSTLLMNEAETPSTSREFVAVQSHVSTHSALVSPSPSPASRDSDRDCSISSCSKTSNSSKREKSNSTKNDKDYLDEAFITALTSEPVEKTDAVDHYELRLAKGFRNLPYRERVKLKMEMLSELKEIEERLYNILKKQIAN